jgi:hypothetical protein
VGLVFVFGGAALIICYAVARGVAPDGDLPPGTPWGPPPDAVPPRTRHRGGNGQLGRIRTKSAHPLDNGILRRHGSGRPMAWAGRLWHRRGARRSSPSSPLVGLPRLRTAASSLSARPALESFDNSSEALKALVRIGRGSRAS